MQSNKANAVWASQTSSQTVGVNNWTQYQLSLTGSSYKFQIDSANTTSTNLRYYTNREGVNITSGGSILLSTNGTSFTSGTAGVTSYVGPTTTSISFGAATNFIPNTYFGNLSSYSPDGTKVYVAFVNQTATNTVPWTIYQYSLPTPFSFTGWTYTGKSKSYVSSTNEGIGFTFKTDGTVLYIMQNNVIRAYALGTAWDISTASSTQIAQATLTLPLTTGNWAGYSGYSHIQFSPDGTKLICQQARTVNYNYSAAGPYGNLALYTLSVPWNISSLTTTTTNYSNLQLHSFTYQDYYGFQVSPEGSKIIVVAGRSGPPQGTNGNLLLTLCTMGSLYNLTTLTINNATADALIVGSSNYYAPAWLFNANGTVFTANVAATNSGTSGTNAGLVSTNTLSFYDRYDVNISSFSLGSAPTFAYNAAPTVRVDAESTSGRINMFPYEVYQASSTTSQAVLYKPTSGYLAANDTVLLNGTTSVTLSSVTEGTNLGVAAVPITTAANRTYSGKALSLSNNDADYNFRISPDGATLIIGLKSGFLGAGLYQYTLATPWDISTAVFANQFVAVSFDNSNLTSIYTIAFDISPDGTRMWLSGCYPTGSSTASTHINIREYTLTNSWNIGAVNPTGVTWLDTSWGLASYTCTAVRFVPNGSQFVVVIADSTPSSYIQYRACATPYLIGTALSGSINWTSSTNAGNVRSVTFTPDGANIITQGTITTFNTISTPNNMATASTANNISSAAARWSWPSGTMSSSSAAAWGGGFSPDGTKYLVMNGANSGPGQTIWQMNVMVIPQTSYTCNFATQGSAPTSVVVPDRSVAQTITTTLSGGNMTFAATAQATNARAIATKITAPGNFTTVTNATLSMWRS